MEGFEQFGPDAIKFMSYTTAPGFEPATGFPSCDFRGDKFVGKDQGDGHHELWKIDNASPQLVAAVLRGGPELNKRLLTANPASLKGLIEEILPDFADEILEHAGDFGIEIPNFRIGVWLSHQ